MKLESYVRAKVIEAEIVRLSKVKQSLTNVVENAESRGIVITISNNNNANAVQFDASKHIEIEPFVQLILARMVLESKKLEIEFAQLE